MEIIKQKITHSKDGEDINPKALIDHLNKMKVASADKSGSLESAMFTKEDTR